MKSRVSCSHPANALLPWYANGTLGADELPWVEEHLEGCPTCAWESGELAEIADELAARPVPLKQAGDLTRRVWRTRMAWGAAAVIAIPLLLGLARVGWERGAAVATAPGAPTPTVYLDLGAGPTRAAAPIEGIELPDHAGAVVISFLAPVAPRARYTFDLKGPAAGNLVSDRPIARLDDEGRCTFSFPPSTFDSPGDYMIVLKVLGEDGDARLYPYPFRVRSRS